MLVNGVSETGSGMMGSSSLSSCLRTGGGKRKRKREEEKERQKITDRHKMCVKKLSR